MSSGFRSWGCRVERFRALAFWGLGLSGFRGLRFMCVRVPSACDGCALS